MMGLRETEIVRPILQGHSPPSAATFPGNAEGTVMVRRHNACPEFVISSQAEFFHHAARQFNERRD